jgi:hypothetical protein
MRVQEERLVRIPLEDLRAALKKSHGIDLSGIEPYLDQDSLVFVLRTETSPPQSEGPEDPKGFLQTQKVSHESRQRRRRRKRNRIKRRGWNIVGKFTNSDGLVANVYEPFVKAILESGLPQGELRRLVRQIMVRNGNSPSEESIDYYLNNTLEFLAQQRKEQASAQ